MFSILTFILIFSILYLPVAAIFWTELFDARKAAQAKEQAKAELQHETERTKQRTE